MKKLLLILAIMFTPLCVFGEGIDTTVEEEINKQLVDVENTGALLLFQKQPVYQRQVQIIRVRKSGAISIFQINGKPIEVKDNK